MGDVMRCWLRSMGRGKQGGGKMGKRTFCLDFYEEYKKTYAHVHIDKRDTDKIDLVYSKVLFEKQKILIAEDNEINQMIIVELMEEFGFGTIILANDGVEVVEKLKENPDVDMILMDCQMPRMSGYDATREIRKMPKFMDLPIIAMTANAMKGDKEKCLEAGMTDYATKPVQPERLLEILSDYLNVNKNFKKSLFKKEDEIIDLDETTYLSSGFKSEEEYLKEEADKLVIHLKDDLFYDKEKGLKCVGGNLKLLIDMGELFEKQFATNIEKLQTAEAEEDFKTVSDIGHSMKGSGATLGFVKIAEIAFELEKEGKLENPDKNKISDLIIEVLDCKDRLKETVHELNNEA